LYSIEDTMAFPVWIDNLVAYSLQIAILAATGTLLACLFRLRMPPVLLRYWQILLLACLFIPLLQNWNHPIRVPVPAVSITPSRLIPNAAVPNIPKSAILNLPEGIALILATGVILRLMWLALGFFRLRLFLRHSKFPAEAWPMVREMQSHIGVRVRLLLSNEIDSPVTFGIGSPMVMVPPSFLDMSAACREAVICHELLHVRRRDWALIIVEEIIRALYWFHPAVWWLLGRIHLAREQSVDREVVQLTGSRQPYLDSLMEIARTRGRPKAIPATLFLKERHLVQRVALLLKEGSMNRFRLGVSLIGIAALLAGTVRLAAGWFPLTGAAVLNQEQSTNSQIAAPRREPIRVGGNVQESKLIYRVEPTYPEVAKAARIVGKVVLTVTVNEEGQVYDIQVRSGHPLLKDAAVSAVKQWRYSPTLLNGEPVSVIATVTVIYDMRDGGSPSTTGVTTGVVPPPPRPVQWNPIPSQGMMVINIGPYNWYQGRAFHSPGGDITAPELALDQERLGAIAASGWPAGSGSESRTPLLFFVFVNEASEIVGIQRIQGPEIPELERELARTRVVAPGLRGSESVPAWCPISVNARIANR
jgi:TonB family protein